jgi:hypothetical protein
LSTWKLPQLRSGVRRRACRSEPKLGDAKGPDRPPDGPDTQLTGYPPLKRERSSLERITASV